jgi:hypothetical protein
MFQYTSKFRGHIGEVLPSSTFVSVLHKELEVHVEPGLWFVALLFYHVGGSIRN